MNFFWIIVSGSSGFTSKSDFKYWCISMSELLNVFEDPAQHILTIEVCISHIINVNTAVFENMQK